MQVTFKALATGTASFLPVVRNHVCRGTGGTASARYCYSVWLRHLVNIAATGNYSSGVGGTVAELGPGDSLGIGLAAMLTGYDRYYALDIKEHANVQRNLEVLAELVNLFSTRAAIPGDDEFPGVQPKLESYAFPSSILTTSVLQQVLETGRIEAITAALRTPNADRAARIQVRYVAPWVSAHLLEQESVDLAFSQAVLEHIDDIQTAYTALHRWLRPGGLMSHNIDYKSHGLTHDWYGHWTLGDMCWRLVRGTRPYLINRLPHSAHVQAIRAAGFDVVVEKLRSGAPPPRAALSTKYRQLAQGDLSTSGAYIIARKGAAV